MLLNNAHNSDANPLPKNMILIGGASKFHCINKKRFSTNFKSVKVMFEWSHNRLHAL